MLIKWAFGKLKNICLDKFDMVYWYNGEFTHTKLHDSKRGKEYYKQLTIIDVMGANAPVW